MPTTNQVLGALRATGNERGAARLLGISPVQVHRIVDAAPADGICDVGVVEWARRRAAGDLTRPRDRFALRAGRRP